MTVVTHMSRRKQQLAADSNFVSSEKMALQPRSHYTQENLMRSLILLCCSARQYLILCHRKKWHKFLLVDGFALAQCGGAISQRLESISGVKAEY